MVKQALVLGAGIQGVLVAIQLARKGYDVKLIDKSSKAVSRASGVNEGKIHLGLIWANDKSFETASYMLESAMVFTPIIESLVGENAPWEEWISAPFDYVCMHDSMLDKNELQQFYDRLENLYQKSYYGQLKYLNTNPECLIRQRPNIPKFLRNDKIQSVWETSELSIDITKFNSWLLSKLMEFENIQLCLGENVEEVIKTSYGYQVNCSSGGLKKKHEGDIVVNCTWESRLSIDKQLGFEPKHGWLYRLKHSVLADLPNDLIDIPSLTFVLGPYGDVVNFGKSRKAYLSWYPDGMNDSSTNISVPIGWENICDGVVYDIPGNEKLIERMLIGLNEFIPGICHSIESEISAGIIYSRGVTEITDRNSELHKRFDVGIQIEKDGYFSIDTGKYTCAPLHAQHLKDKV